MVANMDEGEIITSKISFPSSAAEWEGELEKVLAKYNRSRKLVPLSSFINSQEVSVNLKFTPNKIILATYLNTRIDKNFTIDIKFEF